MRTVTILPIPGSTSGLRRNSKVRFYGKQSLGRSAERGRWSGLACVDYWGQRLRILARAQSNPKAGCRNLWPNKGEYSRYRRFSCGDLVEGELLASYDKDFDDPPVGFSVT